MTCFFTTTLVCSEPDNIQLVGGSSRCAGELKVKQQGEWRKVDVHQSEWNVKTADAVCRQLDCGSAVSARKKMNYNYRLMWQIGTACVQSGSAVRECILIKFTSSSYNLEINCSGNSCTIFL